MSSTILDSFLDAGLIPIVGDDDTKLTYLQETSEELLAEFRAEPGLILRATLVALDPSPPEDDPLLDLSESLLRKRWRAMRGASGYNRPVALLRTILLTALELAGESSVRDAAIIWYTGGRPLPLALPTQEQPIVEALLRRLGEKTEWSARDRWPERGATTSIGLSAPKLSVPSKLHDSLAARLAAAAGPQDAAGNTMPNSNPNWPGPGNSQWVDDFGELAAKAVIEALATFQQHQQRQLIGVLRPFALAIEGQLLAPPDYRIRLLWWREACYSPALQRGYRELDPRLAAVAMPADLAVEVPHFHPQSVEYFLRESVVALIAGSSLGSAAQSLEDWADGLAQLPLAADVLALLGEMAIPHGRPSILDITQDLLGGKCDAGEVPSRLAVAPDSRLSLPDLSVWLFRCLQAQRLTELADDGEEAGQEEAQDAE